MRKVFKGFSLLIIVGILLFLYLPGLSKYFRLKHQEELLNQEIVDLKTKVEDLKKEERLIKTDVAHLEEVMRRELGLVRPGEVVYKLVPEERKSEEKANSTTQAQEKIAASAASTPSKS